MNNLTAKQAYKRIQSLFRELYRIEYLDLMQGFWNSDERQDIEEKLQEFHHIYRNSQIYGNARNTIKRLSNDRYDHGNWVTKTLLEKGMDKQLYYKAMLQFCGIDGIPF